MRDFSQNLDRMGAGPGVDARSPELCVFTNWARGRPACITTKLTTAWMPCGCWPAIDPLYFAANHGREPFFIYLVSLSVGWLGRSVYAVRLPAAIIGTLLIPAAYFMARELFGRRVGLLTAALTTITLWPIHLSLIGFRAGSLPLFIALSIGLGVHAYRSGRALALDHRRYRLWSVVLHLSRQPLHAARSRG